MVSGLQLSLRRVLSVSRAQFRQPMEEVLPPFIVAWTLAIALEDITPYLSGTIFVVAMTWFISLALICRGVQFSTPSPSPQHPPARDSREKSPDSSKALIKEHVDALGKLPRDWWQGWDARGRWFTEEAERKSEGAGRPLGTRFVDSIQDPRRESAMEEGVGEAEKSALLAMFRGMLAFRPNEGLTAPEILRSEWMRRWTLPVLGKEAMQNNTVNTAKRVDS